MSHRAGLRAFQASLRQVNAQFRQRIQRRAQTTAANPAVGAAPIQDSWFQRMWNSPIGLKTVHFWAPVMKWGVVLAGAADFLRPAEKLSLQQNLALMATGSIWTRWCFVIKPKNMLLAAVNFSLFCVGTIQVSRILMYNASQTDSIKDGAKAMGEDLKQTAKDVEHNAETKLKKLEQKL